MPANFSIKFIVNEKTQTRVLRLTHTVTDFTLTKGNFSVTFPDGSTRIKTDFTSPDITTSGAYIDIPAVLGTSNNVITGNYKVDFVALDNSATERSASISFDFNWTKPSNSILNESDVLIPEVKFKDNASYSPIGSFTGTPSRTFSVSFPSTSEASGGSVSSVSENILNVVSSGKYYDGTYTPTSDVTVNYTHSSESRLTIQYVELFTKTFLIKRCPTQLELVGKINSYRALIDAYKDKNDTQFNILSEQYDLVIALYTHLITRYETSTQDGSEPVLRELLSILEPYATSYTPQLTRMLPFELASTGSNSFSVSDGTNTDSIPLGSTLSLLSGNPAFTINVANNIVTYTPVFGSASNTFAQGNDTRFHNAVTIGTANGLSLASQVLSLALATTSTSGAFSASDKAKLDGIAAGANTGTVTSVAISVPSAFSVSGSPITTSGTINISATGNPLQYITGAGALATLNTAAVPELTNLYFTNTRARAAISVTGSLSYNSTTGVISYTTPSETDPVFTASAAYGISSTNISNWNAAYGWGNHASAGYLLASVAASTYQPLDGDLTAIAALAGTSGFLKKTAANTWSLDTNTYLTSFTETDPIYTASSWYTTTNNSSNWNTAFGWGNHALVGYLTAITSGQVTGALGYTPENTANKGAANGYASLDGAGLVPSTQLPSYVDDVLEYADLASLPVTGTTGKIYVTLDTNKIYRWSGTVYVEISSSAGGGGTWGSITGTLSNQTDLQAALDAKQNQLNGTGFVKVSGTTITYDNSTYLTTSSAASTYVPYTGATGNVTLGEWGLTAGYLKFDLTPTGTPTGLGTMYWDAANRTVSLVDGDGDTTLQLGQEERVLVHNNTGSTLTDGQVVYITGSTGELPSVALASNTSEVTSSVTLGVVTETITNGADGFITTSGIVHGLNTLGLTEGAALWLGTGGAFTQTKPVAPANSVLIGYVIKNSGGNGSIFVKIQNGSELDELHNVLITSVANNQGLFYESSTGLWKNKTIAAVLGYTPYDAANPSNYIALTALSSTATGLTYTNTTGVFSLTSGYVIPTTTQQTNWNTAYGWGNHASAGYLTTSAAASTYQPLDGDLTAIAAIAGTSGLLKKTAANTWSLDTNTYLTSYTETDPIYTASSWYTTTNNASNWNTAYGWGNHASAGYLTTSAAASTYQPLDADLTAIAVLAGTSGFLKKTAANTWSLDTNTYLTSITSGNVTAALGYTPVTNARTLTINGTTYDLTADRSWTISAGTTLNGLGFVKANGTTISYDNSTYVPTTGTGATGTWGISVTGTSSNITAYSINQNLATSSTPTFSDIYTNGWFRNNVAGNGLYNQAVSNHFYASDSNSWSIAATGGYPKLWFRDGYGGTSKIAVYSDGNGSGLLNSSSYWGFRMNYGSAYAGADVFGAIGFRSALDYNGEVAGGMKLISHSKRNVGSTKFIKIYAGTNNYFTGFIYGMNFDDYPPNSATNTGSGFSYQFGGWSDGSGSHGDKFFDMLHFGGNNVGLVGREMNTDGNGYIITALTSTGAGGFKCSATIMLFARDMSKVVITYY